MRCDSCEALVINGIYCHEIGCPNKHLDAKGNPNKVKCKWCGDDFTPIDTNEDCCTEDCAKAYYGY